MSEMMRSDRSGRIDVGVAHHELLEDVVLDRAAELFGRHALFFGGDDIERHDRQHRAVHGHRHGHLVERDAGEQRPHVVDRVDRDARHADVAGDARMVAVVAAMGGEIEGDREALLAGGEIAAVEGVGVFRRGEAGILPDGPRLGDVHRRVGAAQIGRDAGIGVEEVEALECRPGRRRASPAMPSGVSQLSHRRSAAARGAAAKSTLAKSGMLAHRACRCCAVSGSTLDLGNRYHEFRTSSSVRSRGHVIFVPQSVCDRPMGR